MADRLEFGIVEAWTVCLAAEEAVAGSLGIPNSTAKFGRIEEVLATRHRTVGAAHEFHVLGRIRVDAGSNCVVWSEVASSNLRNAEGGGGEQCHTDDGLAIHVED